MPTHRTTPTPTEHTMRHTTTRALLATTTLALLATLATGCNAYSTDAGTTTHTAAVAGAVAGATTPTTTSTPTTHQPTTPRSAHLPTTYTPVPEGTPGYSCVDGGNHVCGPGNPDGVPAGCYDRGGVLVVPWTNYQHPQRDPLWARATPPC